MRPFLRSTFSHSTPPPPRPASVQAWCWNMCKRGAKIYFIPDPAHFLKKGVNNLEKSHVPSGTRELYIPEPLVKLTLRMVSEL